MLFEAFSCIHPGFPGFHRKTAPKTGAQSKCKHETEYINKGGGGGGDPGENRALSARPRGS